ncbi:MAG: MBL fold metallo-hydrolase [Candidatus Andersenbacteria bacterium]
MAVKRSMQWLVMVALACVVLVGWQLQSIDNRVVFLDVGQGDAILLQDGRRQILIDGGAGNAVLEPLAAQMPWFDRTIDVVVLSHPQQDHVEGLVHVFQRYDVGLVLLPDASYSSQLQESWLNAVEGAGVPYRFSWYGQQLHVGDFAVKVLGPIDSSQSQAIIAKDVNNASTIMRVDVHGLSLLLTGDAEEPVERLLVQTVPSELLDVDVLKAGHHGSKTSNSTQLLAATSPHSVVISVGGDNRFGHPSPEVLERLQGLSVFRTDEDGSVQFVHDVRGWRVSCLNKTELRIWQKSCTQD